MGRPLIPNLYISQGLNYYRHRVGGKRVYHRLPALDDPEFWPTYKALHEPQAVPERLPPVPESIGALIEDFRGSAEFKNVESSETVSNYLRYLDMIGEKHGHRLVKQVRPAHVYKMRDTMAETPGKANNWLTVFRLLMGHACKIDWIAHNPAAGIKALAIGEYEPWPADLLRVAFEVATPMTRMLVATALCSGQRNSDIIRMQYGWIQDDIMSFEQQKTGVPVSIPLHPLWKEELARLPRRSVTLVYDRQGKPFGTTGAVQSRIRALMAHEAVQEVIADMVARETVKPDTDFVLHGLRKNACCYLLELGLSDNQIGSMLGMSPKMVRHYGKRARALMIAKTAAESVRSGTLIQLGGLNQIAKVG
jgi:Phage integrase family.